MTIAQLQLGFFASLGTSVALLVAVFVTAKLHKVKAHIACVAVMVVALLVTLGFAETLGQRYVFDSLSYWVHLPLAVTATGTLLAPLITGFRHWRGQGSVKAHKIAVGVWVTLVLLALGTGIWMLSAATPKEEAAARASSRTE